MKPFTMRMIKTIKVFVLLFTTVYILHLIVAMKARNMADDVWKQLGISESQAHMNIRNSFIYGDFYYSGAKLAKNIVTGNRAAVVKDLVAQAKKYYSGNEFKTAYVNLRKRSMPLEPKRQAITAESIKEKEKTRLERNLKTAEAGLTSDNPKIKNSAPSRIEKIKAELAALEDPENAVVKKRLADADKMYEAGMKKYQDDLLKFEEKYPEDINVMLAKRLQQMLDITTDVDYDAELKHVGKLNKFVNPVYEKKPAGWKLAYRAGKETTDLVRAEAEKWLKELN